MFWKAHFADRFLKRFGYKKKTFLLLCHHFVRFHRCARSMHKAEVPLYSDRWKKKRQAFSHLNGEDRLRYLLADERAAIGDKSLIRLGALSLLFVPEKHLQNIAERFPSRLCFAVIISSCPWFSKKQSNRYVLCCQEEHPRRFSLFSPEYSTHHVNLLRYQVKPSCNWITELHGYINGFAVCYMMVDVITTVYPRTHAHAHVDWIAYLLCAEN